MSETGAATGSDGLRHEALFYRDREDFVRQIGRFVRDGLAQGESAIVVIPGERIPPLRAVLGPDADRVVFADMAAAGRNPACIIPLWAELLSRHASGGAPVRAVGEPVWAERARPALEDCHLHEALLNRAFAGRAGCWLVCPYDRGALPPQVLATALRTHPYVCDGEMHAESDVFHPDVDLELFHEPLGDPPPAARRMEFAGLDVGRVRQLVADHAMAFGLSSQRVGELIVSVHELVTNSLSHGGGRGILAIWSEGDRLVCEVRDRGVISDPLVGRRHPDPGHGGGRGLWLANHLSELVQVRSSADGTLVRVHASRS